MKQKISATYDNDFKVIHSWVKLPITNIPHSGHLLIADNFAEKD